MNRDASAAQHPFTKTYDFAVRRGCERVIIQDADVFAREDLEVIIVTDSRPLSAARGAPVIDVEVAMVKGKGQAKLILSRWNEKSK